MDLILELQKAKNDALANKDIDQKTILSLIDQAVDQIVLLSKSPEKGSPIVYKHYKGGLYEVHSRSFLKKNNNVVLINYKEVNGNGRIHTRPIQEFFSEIVIDGKPVPKFQIVVGGSDED